MNKEKIISTVAAVVIALQGWILIELVTIRERLARVETKIERVDR